MGLMASRLNRFKRDGLVCCFPLLGKACRDMVDRPLTEGVREAPGDVGSVSVSTIVSALLVVI